MTVTYSITPPGGSWTTPDNGTYTVELGGSPITDADGDTVPTGPVGTFVVATAKIAITKYGLLYNRATKSYTGTIGLTNMGTAAFSGPLFVLFQLPVGAVLENATGTYPAPNGYAYLEISVSSLGVGQTRPYR